jgi:hypothetical protein
MKQIILRNEADLSAQQVCASKLIFVWALYGVGMAVVAGFLGHSAWGQAAAWAIALMIGLRLALATAEAR